MSTTTIKTDFTPGVVVAFEGADGTGKSRALQFVRRQHRFKTGKLACALAQPSDSQVGIEAKHPTRIPSAHTRALLFAADRAAVLEAEEQVLGDGGGLALRDRDAWWSSQVYQGIQWAVEIAPGESPWQVHGFAEFQAWIREINIHGRNPDLTIVLDVPVAERERRLVARGTPRAPEEARSFQRLVAAEYRRLVGEVSGTTDYGRVVLLDASGTPEQVGEACWALVRAELDRAAAAKGGAS